MYVYAPLGYPKRVYVFLLVTVWISLLFVSGCGKDAMKVYGPIDYTDGDEYIAFTAEDAVPSFSFEYPSDYTLYSYQPMPGYPSTSVILSDVDYQYQEVIIDGQIYVTNIVEYPPEAEWDYKDINIYVHKANEYAPGAETEVNERIDEYKQMVRAGYNEDFKLLEKNRVMVAGMEGWEIVVSFTDLPVIPPGFPDAGPRTRAVSVIGRELFFDYQNTVWRISVFSDAGNADQAKLDYEHILGTLRILD